MKFMALMLLSFDTTFKCDVQAMGFQNQVIEIIIHKKKIEYCILYPLMEFAQVYILLHRVLNPYIHT